MVEVFISYSRRDSGFVQELYQRLNEDPLSVWYDQKIKPGDDWWKRIKENIQQCDVFLFIISKEALASEYCQKEFQLAIDKKKLVIPILLNRTPEFFENDSLREMQALDATNMKMDTVLHEILTTILADMSSSTQNRDDSGDDEHVGEDPEMSEPIGRPREQLKEPLGWLTEQGQPSSQPDGFVDKRGDRHEENVFGIEELLPKVKNTLLTEGKHVIIHGMDGLGKTTTVKKLIFDHEVEEHFSGGIAYIQWGEEKDISQEITDHFDGLAESVEAEKRFLVVVDDIRDTVGWDATVPSSVDYILITPSLSLALDLKDVLTDIEIVEHPALTDVDAIRLLRSKLKEGVVEQIVEAHLQTLCLQLGNIPLYIELYAKSLNKEHYRAQQRPDKERIKMIRRMIEDPRFEQSATAPETILDFFYERLKPEEQEAFHYLSAFKPGVSFTVDAMVEISGLDSSIVYDLLEELPTGSEVLRPAIARPIIDYAHLKAGQKAPGINYDEAFFQYYTLEAHKQNKLINKEEPNQFEIIFEPHSDDVANILFALKKAKAHADDSHVTKGILGLFPYLYQRGRYSGIKDYLEIAHRHLEQQLNESGQTPAQTDQLRMEEAQVLLYRAKLSLRTEDHTWEDQKKWLEDALDLAEEGIQYAESTTVNVMENAHIWRRLKLHVLNTLGIVAIYYFRSKGKEDQGLSMGENLWKEGVSTGGEIEHLKKKMTFKELYEYMDLHRNLGSLMGTIGDYAESKRYFSDALDIDPGNKGLDPIRIAVLQNLGTHYVEGWDHQQAIKRLCEATEILAGEPEKFKSETRSAIYLTLGKANVDRTYYRKALNYLHTAREIATTHNARREFAQVQDIFAEAYLKLGQLEDAKKEIDQIPTKYKDDAAHYIHGQILHRLGSLDEARSELEEILQQGDNRDTYYYEAWLEKSEIIYKENGLQVALNEISECQEQLEAHISELEDDEEKLLANAGYVHIWGRVLLKRAQFESERGHRGVAENCIQDVINSTERVKHLTILKATAHLLWAQIHPVNEDYRSDIEKHLTDSLEIIELIRNRDLIRPVVELAEKFDQRLYLRSLVVCSTIMLEEYWFDDALEYATRAYEVAETLEHSNEMVEILLIQGKAKLGADTMLGLDIAGQLRDKVRSAEIAEWLEQILDSQSDAVNC